jgi:hypothetical protein
MSETAPAGPVLPAETLDPTTLTDEELKQRLQIQTADMSHGVVETARDKAHEQLHRQTTGEVEGRYRFVRFVKKVKRGIWDANLKRDYTVLTGQVEGRQQITREGNIHALHGGTQEDHDRTAAAVVERVTSGFVRSNETQTEMGKVANGIALQDGLTRLVKDFAEGKIEHDDLIEAKDKLVGRFAHGLRQNERMKGLLLADNVVEVARNARAAVNHGIGMDRIDAAMSARHAEVRMGARTEVRRNAAEKATEWLYSRKAGTLVNETTIAAAVSVAVVATKFAVRKGASLAGNATRAATLGLVNVGVGVTAAIRESMHVKQDSQTHVREMAYGGGDELTTAGKYREELEETRFETVSFQELMSELETAQASAGSSKDGLQAALATLTHVRTRINLSDEEKIDLITYTSRLGTETERTKLDIKLAEARVAVQTALDGADTTTLNAAGIDILKKDARDVGSLMDTRCVDVEDQLLESVDARDAAVRKLARHKALKAGVTAMVVGDFIGEFVQEAQGAVSGSEQGLFEKNTGQERRTMLAGIFRHDEHNPGAAPNADSMTTVGQHAGFVPPEGYNLQHVDGKWELFDSHNNVVDDNVTFDSDGHLSEMSQHDLTEKGFHFAEHSQKVADPNVVGHHDVPQTPNEYVKSHPHEFTHMHRTDWMANNTEKPDLNEDRLDWGGANGTGVDEHGNYILSVARMTPNGSFEGGLSENARQLMQEGNLKVALSMTEGTQSHVVMVSVDKHGNALIEKGSFAARAMFSRHDGQLHFTGAYAEAVALGDTQPNGTQNVHVLATVIGENHVNHNALIDRQPTIKAASHEQIITSLTAPETTSPVDMPLVLPVRSRRGLEYVDTESETNPSGSESNTDNPYSAYGNGYHGEALRSRYEQWRTERSPRLEENPSADLNTGEELQWYRDEQKIRRGEEYISEIDDNIAGSEILRNIGDETKALVCIPVAAANESENIYKTLSLYAQQSEEAQKATVILMNLNWKQELESDPDTMAKIQKTHDEIERARADFPGLRLATFDKVWTPEFITERTDEAGNVKMYGEVVKVLYDTAAFAVGQGVREGRRDSASEAILVTNDADALGMSRNYLGRYINTMEADPTIDAFTGAIRWGTKDYADYPGYGLVSGIYSVFNIATQRRGANKMAVSTIGPNSAFRMSAYAAVGGGADNNRQGAGADWVLGHRIISARAETGAAGISVAAGYPNSGYTNPTIDTSLTSEDTARTVSAHVGGAQIDTLGDRLLGAYRQGRWISSGWDAFDSGGYEDRSVSAAAGTLGREDPRKTKDMDAIADRVGINIEGFVNNWYREPATATGALALYFGTEDDKGNPLYTTKWEGGAPGRDGEGTFKFEFTPEGKKWLQQRLLRDGRGRWDPYGERIQRQLYNIRGRGRRSRRPTLANPRFVSHTE